MVIMDNLILEDLLKRAEDIIKQVQSSDLDVRFLLNHVSQMIRDKDTEAIKQLGFIDCFLILFYRHLKRLNRGGFPVLFGLLNCNFR